MKVYSIIVLLLCITGCANSTGRVQKQTSNNEVVVRWPEGTENLQISKEKANKIRPLLDVYYTNNKISWAQSRQEILAMGVEGKHILCLFFIKFFAAGKQSFDVDKHWAAACYELASLKEFAVPYLISTMALESMGTTGKIQCAKSLSLIGKPAVPALIENLERGDESFQRRVIEVLGEIPNNKEATTSLTDYYQKLRDRALQDEEKDYEYGKRLYIISALANIKDHKNATSTIELALSDPHRNVRKAAIEASIAYASPENVYLLKKAEKVSRSDFPLSKYHTQINTIIYGYNQ